MQLSAGWLDRLRALRTHFLAEDRGEQALADYWQDDRDLAAYDALLAARIGWKWDAALAEAMARGLAVPADATVLDFGCGTGIAARRFLAHFGAREVLCLDRSARARAFAVARLRAEQPRLKARALATVGDMPFDVLLVSHVLGELDAAARDVLLTLAGRARVVLWVEPGSRVIARALATLRERLRAIFHVVAPCPHAAVCPTLANADDWCHFFAAPPPEVFTSGDWVKAARELGIDLRALPYTFLALSTTAPSVPAPAHRLLGRADIGKHDATRLACTAAGLTRCTVSKRAEPALWRQWKKDPAAMRTRPEA